DSAAQKNNFSSRATKSASRFKALEKALDRLEKNKIEKYKEADRVKLDFHETDFGASRLLQIRQMTFGYDGIPIFKDFNLDVKRSERLAVIGPNGSGKTTLLQLILGRKQPEEGMVQLH
ncbi:ATP-binding cassette domain-containing protein, partial [Escherichia coli]